jgi:hypothetical protein
MEIRDLDDDFIDKIIIAIAAGHYASGDGMPSKTDLEYWFKYAVAINEARDAFRSAASDEYDRQKD